jgi:hypothetical protein
MSHKELVADARRFVERTFVEVGGRRPSKRAMAEAAEKIARALTPTLRHDPANSGKR